MTERGQQTRDDLLTALLSGAALGAATGGPPGALIGALAGVGLGAAAQRKRAAGSEVIDAETVPVEDAPLGQRLKDLAAAADITPATAYQHLRRLEAEQKVERVEGPSGPAYVPAYHFQAEFIDPLTGTRHKWQTTHPVDWRFPLVSRVPDDAAAEFLYEWLDRAAGRRLLPALHSVHEPADDFVPLRIVVYGSCARGDARRDSDVDVLLDVDPEWAGTEALIDLAHEISLGKARNVDVRVWSEDSQEDFLENVLRDGRTIWTNLPEHSFVELDGADA